MTKYSYYLLLFSLLLFSGCQSVEQLSIDYMLPAEVSFPETLKRVAIVNNMPEVPDNKLIASEEDKKKSETEIARKVDYYNGDATITTEALANALAAENYFNEIVICDSALRAKDITPRENTLTKDEVNELTQSLDVDFLIALENIQMHSIRRINFIPDIGAYYGTIDMKVYPTIKVYLPNRKGPMVVVNSNDSIFWDAIGGTETFVLTHLISEKDMLKEASEFAGTVSVKHLLPHWETANRYMFTGGSVNMRDAAVYVKEKQWNKAIELWKQTYQTKKGKQKMRAAYNLALGYEMQDSIEIATDWALKAQVEARKIDEIDKRDSSQLGVGDFPNYMFTTLYVTELKIRKEGISRLNMQMQRFNNDF